MALYNPRMDWSDRTVSLQCDGTEYLIQAVHANEQRNRIAKLHVCTAKQFAQTLRSRTLGKPFAVRVGEVLQQLNSCVGACRPDHPSCNDTSNATPQLQCNTAPSNDAGTKPHTRWDTLCDEFQDIFTDPSGTPPDREIKHKIELLDPQQPIRHHR